MDAALLALATSCANSLIALITTDSWVQAKRGIRKAFGRSGEAAADQAEGELTEARRELESSVARNDTETVDELRVAWRGKFRRLLIEHPESESLIRSILQDWDSAISTPQGSQTIVQNATARESGRVYQQGSGTQNNY